MKLRIFSISNPLNEAIEVTKIMILTDKGPICVLNNHGNMVGNGTLISYEINGDRISLNLPGAYILQDNLLDFAHIH